MSAEHVVRNNTNKKVTKKRSLGSITVESDVKTFANIYAQIVVFSEHENKKRVRSEVEKFSAFTYTE
jgi:hypothetical protein